MDALKRRAGRYTKELENNSPQIAANFRSNDEVAKTAGISGIHSTLPQGAVTLSSLKRLLFSDVSGDAPETSVSFLITH